ncbi:hypothetical protein DFLDMN_006214 (plasmid) [Cupriavidus sp. H19C3]
MYIQYSGADMGSGTGFQAQGPREPEYVIADMWMCRRCTHLRVSIKREYPYHRLRLDCALGYAWMPVRWCDDFAGEPGVD